MTGVVSSTAQASGGLGESIAVLFVRMQLHLRNVVDFSSIAREAANVPLYYRVKFMIYRGCQVGWVSLHGHDFAEIWLPGCSKVSQTPTTCKRSKHLFHSQCKSPSFDSGNRVIIATVHMCN